MELVLKPQVLQWARQRASLQPGDLADKLRLPVERVAEWEQSGRITFSLAKKLAQVTRTAEGHLYLQEPPEDRLPIPDFRTVGDAPVRRPSPDLLETVYSMQRRQDWMHDFLVEEGEAALPFVASATLDSRPDEVAASMRKVLGVADGWAREEKTWTEALMHLRQRIEAAGVLITINGVVGNNVYRKLSADEFRGFALVDSHAPLVFINGTDFKGAQMFTFIHELAHIWLGQEGVSNFDALHPAPAQIELWCNAVAAEFLVPAREVREAWPAAQRMEEPYQYLAGRFKVSTIVAARRVLDLGLATRDEFMSFYRFYRDDERRKAARSATGGNFWANQNVRVGQRFGSAVVVAAREGRLLYREAYQLTGLSGSTFDRFAETLGFRVR
jgi:Zn-dependent peptidase ImmA (M78 family)